MVLSYYKKQFILFNKRSNWTQTTPRFHPIKTKNSQRNNLPHNSEAEFLQTSRFRFLNRFKKFQSLFLRVSGQNRPILENLQILNRWSKIDSDFFNRTLDAPKRAWTNVSWPQRSYRFLSADKPRGLLNLRIRSTGATVDRFWCVDYNFDGNGLKKSLQVFVLWYLSLEDRKALSCERQFFRKSFISEISL